MSLPQGAAWCLDGQAGARPSLCPRGPCACPLGSVVSTSDKEAQAQQGKWLALGHQQCRQGGPGRSPGLQLSGPSASLDCSDSGSQKVLCAPSTYKKILLLFITLHYPLRKPSPHACWPFVLPTLKGLGRQIGGWGGGQRGGRPKWEKAGTGWREMSLKHFKCCSGQAPCEEKTGAHLRSSEADCWGKPSPRHSQSRCFDFPLRGRRGMSWPMTTEVK